MQRVTILEREHRDGRNLEFIRRAKRANGNFASIGYEQLLYHVTPFLGQYDSCHVTSLACDRSRRTSSLGSLQSVNVRLFCEETLLDHNKSVAVLVERSDRPAYDPG
jgi:hypothetical protein